MQKKFLRTLTALGIFLALQLIAIPTANSMKDDDELQKTQRHTVPHSSSTTIPNPHQTKKKLQETMFSELETVLNFPQKVTHKIACYFLKKYRPDDYARLLFEIAKIERCRRFLQQVDEETAMEMIRDETEQQNNLTNIHNLGG